MASGEDGERVEQPSVRDHLANDRTLLAWIRTALTVIALGFLVDRLAVQSGPAGPASVLGVSLVVLGGLVAAAGGYSWLGARRDMAAGRYRPQAGLHMAVVGAVVLGAVIVAAYLVFSN